VNCRLTYHKVMTGMDSVDLQNVGDGDRSAISRCDKTTKKPSVRIARPNIGPKLGPQLGQENQMHEATTTIASCPVASRGY
jgi:hypothetical protein